MLDPKVFEDMAQQLGKLAPPGLDRLRADFEKNVKAGVQAAMDRMELVSREEFEVQKAVLRRSREKIEALERQIAALESRLDPS